MKLYRLTWKGDFPMKRIVGDLKKSPELMRGLAMRLEMVGIRSFHAMYLVPAPGAAALLETATQDWDTDSRGWIDPDPEIFRISEPEEADGKSSILHLVSSDVVTGPALV